MSKALSEGLSAKQIGEKLFIATETVNAHLKSVYRKLNISGRFELLKKTIEGKLYLG